MRIVANRPCEASHFARKRLEHFRGSTANIEILEHTADIGICVLSSSLEELFADAAWGVQNIAFDAAEVQAAEAYELAASGEDLEALMVNWLNEIIYWLDARQVAFARFEVLLSEEAGTVKATGWGEPREDRRHPSRLVVKAATYHLLRIGEIPEGWFTEVYLDI